MKPNISRPGAVAFVAGLALVGGVLLTLRSATQEPSHPAVPVAVTSTTTSTTTTTSTSNPPSNGTPPLSDYEASYGLFVEAWNKVYDTGSLIHLRQIVGPESLSIYGEEACVAHIQSRERIGEEYELVWAAVPAQGPSLVELDGITIVVDIDTPATIGWPGGQFDATWLKPPAEATSTLGNRFKRIVLLDCGDPIDGAVGLPSSGPCRAAAEAEWSSIPESVEVSVELEAATIGANESFVGSVVVTNRGEVPMEFSSGLELVGFVFQPGGVQPIAKGSGALRLSIEGWLLDVGESARLDLVAGTHSCNGPEVTLESGDYELQVLTGWGFTDPVPVAVQ